MKGVIWHIYRNQEKGMIRGDDGVQVPFRRPGGLAGLHVLGGLGRIPALPRGQSKRGELVPQSPGG